MLGPPHVFRNSAVIGPRTEKYLALVLMEYSWLDIPVPTTTELSLMNLAIEPTATRCFGVFLDGAVGVWKDILQSP